MKRKTCCGAQSIVLSTVHQQMCFNTCWLSYNSSLPMKMWPLYKQFLFPSLPVTDHIQQSQTVLLVKLHLRSVFTGSARFIILHCTRATRQLMMCAVNTDFCIMPNKAGIVDGMALVPICYVFITFHSLLSWVPQRSILQCVTIGWLRPGCRVHPARQLFAILQRLCFW